MSRPSFWSEKLAQLFHDPFLKAWCQGQTAKELAGWLGGMIDGEEDHSFWEKYAQDKVGMLLSQRLLGEQFVFPGKGKLWLEAREAAERLEAGYWAAQLSADLAATGADRPVLGTAQQVRVHLWDPGQDHVVVTHPLTRAHLNVPVPKSLAELKEKLDPSLTQLDQYRQTLQDLTGEQRNRRAALLTWRCLPEDLAQKDGVFWPLQPADTRCPDHSIWDHLRMNSALGFIAQSDKSDDRVRGANRDRRPWLFSAWVGPAREFLGLARTGRDLWTGSILLAELAWAMLEPIAEELGPDAILYPDLRANPRADRWLYEKDDKVLNAFRGSRSSLIPNRFVAVVPEARLEELAEASRNSVERRWQEMAEKVREYLKKEHFGTGPWEHIFEEQVRTPPVTRWVAVPWKWYGQSGGAKNLKRQDIVLPPLFPFQADPPRLPEPVEKIEAQRRKCFSGWIEDGIFNHYQATRYTYLQTHPGYLLGQRGFDYPLDHHMLLAALDARKRLGDRREVRDEPGEKCTLCGARQALTNKQEGRVGEQREAARNLWKRPDPEGLGAERLCGPCAVRRYLSESEDRIKESWRATIHASERGGCHDVPFPSTGLVAGQRWLDRLCQNYQINAELQRAVAEFVQAFLDSKVRPTQFAGALPRFRRHLQHNLHETLKKLLEIDIQYLDPAMWERLQASEVPHAQRVGQAARSLRQQVVGSPGTHLAVVCMDGDSMGELLLGSPSRIGTRWKDVLHPTAVDKLLEDKNGACEPWKRAWRSTLECNRLMGPSLHAFVRPSPAPLL